MKTNTLLASLTAGVFAIALTGCDKKPAAETPAPMATNAAATSTMDAAKDMAGKAVDTAKDATATAVDATKAAAGKAVDAAKDATAAAATAVQNATVKATDAVKDAVAPTPAPADTATAQFTAVVANTKQFLADKKYQDALDELKKLADVKLTDDQQKIVDGLKAEAQKMLSSAGTSAVNSLLGK